MHLVTVVCHSFSDNALSLGETHMANAVVDQVFLVTYRGVLHNQTIMTTYWYQLKTIPAGGGSIIDASNNLATALAVAAGHQETYLWITPSNYLLQEVWIQCVFPTRYRKTVYTRGLPGLSINSSSTTNVSCSIARAGEVAARNTQGGVRIPLSPDDVTNGNLSAGMLAIAGSHVTQMKTVLGVAPNWVWWPGMLSHVYDGDGNIVQTFFTLTGFVTLQGSARVVRRRTVGLGI